MYRGVSAWILASVLALLDVSAAIADDKVACRPGLIGESFVQAVLDGRTMLLRDGRELRLAGIEVSGSDGAAKASLEAATDGRAVVMLRLGAGADRYGRISGLAVAAGSERRSLQVMLLAQGQARVAARVGDDACAAEFLTAERQARAAGLGLWSDPAYLIKSAGNPGEILAERGRFTVVEGVVVSVRESGSTIYVNFSRRWSDDFTVTVPKRNERRFVTAGLELKNLADRRVRVRGTVEERGGPWIEATRPEQIELAGHD